MSAIKFDKRLYNRYLKSEEATREELAQYHAELPDLSDQLRHRQEETEEAESAGEGASATPEASDD